MKWKLLVSSRERWNSSKFPSGRSESWAEDVPHQRTEPAGQLNWFILHFMYGAGMSRHQNMEVTNITDMHKIHARNHDRLDSAVRDKNKIKPVGDIRG